MNLLDLFYWIQQNPITSCFVALYTLALSDLIFKKRPVINNYTYTPNKSKEEKE